jgi:hypothetical protein
VKVTKRYVAVYRVIEREDELHYVWDWIGTHEDFNKEYPW